MKRKYIIMILIMITINQITVLNRNIHMGFSVEHTIIFIAGLICDGIIVFIMFRQNEKKRIAEELEEARFQAEKERIYYQELENRRMEMAKIRHDYNNIITSVLGLIQMERPDEAKDMLDELQNRIEKAKGEEND